MYKRVYTKRRMRYVTLRISVVDNARAVRVAKKLGVSRSAFFRDLIVKELDTRYPTELPQTAA